ncbi:amidase [Leekyejoonella antrihumi]|uniref:Asp-tRNA(Asn)/Glu-tRNA(Gln) amidotransferase subunit GatA n=1 Tax=Leekyejoonella antrihumi TaxID=1660198 RepID=A0A563DZU5_9MICO|nr:amidase [Leekyejoonella antrihumi]TWP35798.1 Asp-tRNA(Asn)/Glu-tRNA(Gln) amidotransferase subunit GatA [Leekyejoonella antrihumi]
MPDVRRPGKIMDLATALRNGSVSSTELVGRSLDLVHERNPSLNAFISVYEDRALQAAQQADARIAGGRAKGLLDGVPLAVKDNLYMQGLRTTMGSRIHGDFVPQYTATCVERLEASGAIIVGKTNLHEYALGLTTDNPYYGTCKNPWNPEKIPGGSSGGSAVAVSTGMVAGALGSDTSGSIRIPAAMCGVVGLKPTYGLVSRYGCFPEAWTLDHVGLLTESVEDTAILLDAISGWDPKDRSSLRHAPTCTHRHLTEDLSGTVIGVERDFFFSDVDESIAERTQDALHWLQDNGATIKDVRIPSLRDAVYALTIIDTSETTTVHQDSLRQRPEDYGPEVRFLLECGALPSAVDYLTAQQLRETIRADFQDMFRGIDVLLTPTVPILTPDIGQERTRVGGKDVDVIESAMRLVGPANLIGLPSLSIPCGMAHGMPTGVQIIGAPLAEQTVLNVALALESAQLDLKY